MPVGNRFDSEDLAMEFRDATTVFLAEVHPRIETIIGVAGPDASEALSLLWRRGFKRSRLAISPLSRGPDLDALFVTGARGLAQIDAILATAAGSLRCGTPLGVDLSAMPAETGGLALLERLAPLGFVARPGRMPHLIMIAERASLS